MYPHRPPCTPHSSMPNINPLYHAYTNHPGRFLLRIYLYTGHQSLLKRCKIFLFSDRIVSKVLTNVWAIFSSAKTSYFQYLKYRRHFRKSIIREDLVFLWEGWRRQTYIPFFFQHYWSYFNANNKWMICPKKIQLYILIEELKTWHILSGVTLYTFITKCQINNYTNKWSYFYPR